MCLVCQRIVAWWRHVTVGILSTLVQVMACQAPRTSHYPSQCWLNHIWTFRNKLQGHLKHNTTFFIQQMHIIMSSTTAFYIQNLERSILLMSSKHLFMWWLLSADNNHYLNQCLLRTSTPYGTTRLQRAAFTIFFYVITLTEKVGLLKLLPLIFPLTFLVLRLLHLYTPLTAIYLTWMWYEAGKKCFDNSWKRIH